MAATPAPRSTGGGPLKALLGGGVALLVGSVLIVAILGSVLGGGGSSCGEPTTSAATSLPAPGTAGTELRGRVSWFGGPNDSMAGPTTATGLPVTHPGIAVYNTATKGGWWWVRFPNGRAAILQQTDVGPAPWTHRVVDVLYSALPAIGYTEGNFPTNAEVTAHYLGKSDRWAQAPGAITGAATPLGVAPSSPTSCDAAGLTDTGVPGKVEIAAGANRPGASIARETLAFVARIAGIAGRKIVITTGTNHSEYTVDGNVSDHWDGHAADIGMAANGGTNDSPVGDRIMAACLIAAGQSPEEATANARAGGLYTLVHDGLRIQCIWKTYEGGNHHNHVHAGANPVT
jgi:hypothetical protein